MKRFLLIAGFALPTLPVCVHANDFHRVLTEAQAELRQTEMLSGPARSGASSALLERLAALEHATREDPILLEKAQRLSALARFQLVHGGRIVALDLPAAVPTFRQPGAAGESCESPLPLNTGEAVELQMRPGESVWIRVQGTTEKAIGVSTRGSSLDTHLSAWPDCREQVAEPFATADDSIGLQAELTLPTDNQTFWLVRLDNLSDQAGPVPLGGVDFSLVQGTVVRSADGTPFSEARVGMFRVVNGEYWLEGTTQVDAQGRYLIGYQQNGAYVFRTGSVWSWEQLAYEAWIDVPCAERSETSIHSCTFGTQQLTQVPLSGGSATLNFALDALGAVTGVIRDAATGAPVPNASIHLEFNRQIFTYASTASDSLGRYRLGLLNGLDAYLIAEASGYRSQLYNGVDCPVQGCALASGTPVRNDPANPVLRADFALSRAPRLEVDVRIGGTPAPETEYFTLTLFDASGAATYSRSFYGPRVSIDDLAAGDYRVRIESRLAYPQLHSGIECVNSCIDELNQAAVISFPASGPGNDIAFDLRARPVLRGSVRSEANGEPVANAQVMLYDTNGVYVGETWTHDGRFELTSIPPGSYVLLVNSPDHVREVFDNIPCPAPNAAINCPGATQLVFTRESGDREVEIELTPNPIVTGRVNVEWPGQSFGAELQTLSSNGQVIRRIWLQTGAQGTYSTQAFPPGSVRFGATDYNYWDQVFPQIDCVSGWSGQFSGCDLSNAAVFDLQPGQTYEGIDFRLRPRGARGFRVVGASDNAPLHGVGIDIWNSSGTRIDSVVSSAEGVFYVHYSTNEPWFLSTFNTLGLEDQVYSGIRCPAGPVYFGQCSLQGATPIPVPVSGSTLLPEIVIRMSDGIILFNHGFEP